MATKTEATDDLPPQTTTILPVNATKIGTLSAKPRPDDLLDELVVHLDPTSPDAKHVLAAAEQLRHSDVPVAFPTETVYGLGADATRSEAVRGIYRAKRRPADNPLICHFSSLDQIRALLRPSCANGDATTNGHDANDNEDPIPAIYHPLIRRFWPGPLTLLLPLPSPCPLAPEVTASLSTFGARIPRHALALALIHTASRPIAAPSANASTKPSPTTSEHVFFDLKGRISTILDGGPCDVGVESTVVDGLCHPPVVLRPGGVSLEMLRACPGWENVQAGYGDVALKGGEGPRAPGMKYRHYSPKARVVLFESARAGVPGWGHLESGGGRVGIVRTARWRVGGVEEDRPVVRNERAVDVTSAATEADVAPGFKGMVQTLSRTHAQRHISTHTLKHNSRSYEILDIGLGGRVEDIARGVFAALRELDGAGVEVIFVEGISDAEGDRGAAAVMNRLRKAAEVEVKSDS